MSARRFPHRQQSRRPKKTPRLCPAPAAPETGR